MPSFGWKPDEVEHIRSTPEANALHRAERYGYAGLALPKLVNELGKFAFIRNQESTSSCVGFAVTGAVYARLRYLGFGVGPFSPLALYANARQLEGLYKGKPLPDEGSYFFLAMSGSQRFGLVDESAWPFDNHHDERVSQELPFDIFQKASQFRLSGFARITAEGHTRVDVCKRALAKGHPVPLGMMVGSEFESYRRGKGPVGVETGDDTGRHATFLVGYEDDGEVFVGVNSWSRDYGDDGFYRIHRSKLEHESTTDLYDFTITDQRLTP